MMKLVKIWPANVQTRFRSEFVPRHDVVTELDVKRLQDFIDSVKRLLVLTGAGVSTESGLPDYRSAEVGLYAKSGHKPMEISQFMSKESMRKKYWARNYIAFPRLCRIEPNKCHYALAEWERKGHLTAVVTQNVDGFHQKAGSKHVVELHGTGYIVKCTNRRENGCNYEISRHHFQKQLDKLNGDLFANLDTVASTLRPDMDIDIESDLVKKFTIPSCPQCGGILKPDIIFFGDNVPKERVTQIYEKVADSDALLVVGSSLSVYSGYRFALHARELQKPIAIVNIGETRANHLSVLHINRRCGQILPLIKV